MGKLTNLNPPASITDSDIPAAIARDAEVDTKTTAAITAHKNETDPHPTYLTPSEGDARYRLISAAITDAELPATIARDTEVDAKTTAAITAHVNAIDPHPTYLTPGEGDGRYRLSSTALFTAAPFPAASVAGNSIAVSWNSVQPGQGIGEFCNYAGTGGGDAFNFFRMPGNATSAPTLSHRVARIDIGGAYIQTSDKRLKSNFSPAPGLEALMELKPFRYIHWGCNGFDETTQNLKVGKFFTHKLGFLAQDVQKVIPEAVSIPFSNEELWGIDYNCLLACAIRSLQELKQEVDELRSQLKAKV